MCLKNYDCMFNFFHFKGNGCIDFKEFVRMMTEYYSQMAKTMDIYKRVFAVSTVILHCRILSCPNNVLS